MPFKRSHRASHDLEIEIAPNYKVQLLHSNGYRKSISLARALADWTVAKRFSKFAPEKIRPDLILCCMPTLDLAVAATDYGRRFSVPVVLDLRDLWPDIFAERLPPFLRHCASVIFAYQYWQLRKACGKAAAIVGITPEFVSWGLTHAGRAGTQLDRDFPLAYPDITPDEDAQAKAQAYWRSKGVKVDRFIITFLGAFYQRSSEELAAVIHAADLLADDPRFQFVLCGDGPELERCQLLANGLDNVVFPGWVAFSEGWCLMRLASVGILPYPSTNDFKMSIPNKAIEYMSAGLPVLSSIKGKLEALLEQHKCGVTYPNSSPGDLAATLRGLEQDAPRLRLMGRNARRLYEAQFVAGTVYANMADHLENVVAAAREPRAPLDESYAPKLAR
jgi:glycosyltransferase involved in cell wall biosynthesis